MPPNGPKDLVNGIVMIKWLGIMCALTAGGLFATLTVMRFRVIDMSDVQWLSLHWRAYGVATLAVFVTLGLWSLPKSRR